MKALNNYVIVELVEEPVKEIVTTGGIILPNGEEKTTTNNGDKVGVKQKLVVVDAPNEFVDDLVGKKVVVNLYELQLFDNGDKTYGTIPISEVKVVLDD